MEKKPIKTKKLKAKNLLTFSGIFSPPFELIETLPETNTAFSGQNPR
jgi:hypothetical protein